MDQTTKMRNPSAAPALTHGYTEMFKSFQRHKSPLTGVEFREGNKTTANILVDPAVQNRQIELACPPAVACPTPSRLEFWP